MTTQLEIFATGIHCSICLKDPGRKQGCVSIWYGFRDADTGHYCCWQCRAGHYHRKFQNKALKGLFSEMPVVL